MRYLKYFNYIFTGLLLLVGCEMENNSVEILSFSASDSVAVSGEGIMLYCEAQDGDGIKRNFLNSARLYRVDPPKWERGLPCDL